MSNFGNTQFWNIGEKTVKEFRGGFSGFFASELKFRMFYLRAVVTVTMYLEQDQLLLFEVLKERMKMMLIYSSSYG